MQAQATPRVEAQLAQTPPQQLKTTADLLQQPAQQLPAAQTQPAAQALGTAQVGQIMPCPFCSAACRTAQTCCSLLLVLAAQRQKYCSGQVSACQGSSATLCVQTQVMPMPKVDKLAHTSQQPLKSIADSLQQSAQQLSAAQTQAAAQATGTAQVGLVLRWARITTQLHAPMYAVSYHLVQPLLSACHNPLVIRLPAEPVQVKQAQSAVRACHTVLVVA